MNTISTIPIELLHKIIPLTVEDSIAIDDERSRRNILLNLALVSKEFTLPAQKLLWEYMDFDDVVKVQDLIREGFGKDKIIKVLGIISSSNTINGSQINLNIIEQFLHGIQELHYFSLTLLCIHINDSVRISNFFSIPSTKSLNYLMHTNYLEFTSEDSTPPPALTSFQRFVPEGNNDEVIAIFKSSVSSLRSLSIFTSFSEAIYNPPYLPSFRLAAPNLTSLSILATNNSVAEALLPFCTSLKSLELHYSEYNLPQIMKDLLLLNSSVFLSTLLLHWFVIATSDFPSLVQILDSKQLKNLKLLYMSSNTTKHDQFTKMLEDEVKFVEECNKRGIRLSIGTEREVRRREEKAKQLAYTRRQVILDARVVE